MDKEIMTQAEFIEKCKRGETIENIRINFLDISNIKITDVVIKNSVLRFCTFRECDMSNVKFIKCEIYFGSFYTGQINNTAFDNCKIELTLFDSIQFDRTKMTRCNINYMGILGSNTESMDMITSHKHRVITDVSQITPEILEEATTMSMLTISRLDISLQMKIKQLIHQDTERYNVDNPLEKKKKGEYAADNSTITYGEVKNLIAASFGAYAEKKTYEIKPTYKTKTQYK
ncbi:MAG: pentapeptide repeat-containing protein [Candidatus Aenigmarchaeota archaeon]|nr:pentapeptide repeat-containing protein [Candidatus Aenigmarchaeota archaeon]